jgi:hypothetical protein
LRYLAVCGLVLLLSACASERQFARDTWPFGNPNAPPATSETAQRVLGKVAVVTPIPPQAGDVWPGPVQPMPTINEEQRDMNLPLGQAYTPSLPSPYPPGQEPPGDVLPGASVPVTGGALYSAPQGGQPVIPPPTQK